MWCCKASVYFKNYVNLHNKRFQWFCLMDSEGFWLLNTGPCQNKKFISKLLIWMKIWLQSMVTFSIDNETKKSGHFNQKF